MPEPKSRAELGESLAKLFGAGTSTLIVDPATRTAAISNDIDHEGLAIEGTGPRLLRTRRNEPQESPAEAVPSTTPKPPEPPPTAPTVSEEPPGPTWDEQLDELQRDIQRTKGELALELLPHKVMAALKRRLPSAPAQPQPAPPREDKQSKRQAACEEAVRQFGAARTPEEIDAAVTRIGELSRGT